MAYQPQTFQNATKVPQNLPELMVVYHEKEADANRDLTGETDPRTRPGLETRKNGAIQALPGLRSELVRLVEQNAGAIFLSGSKEGMESFIATAQELLEGAVVFVSAKEIYTELAKLTERGLRTDRRFSMDTLNSFVDGTMRILDRLDVEGIPAPNLVPQLNKVFPDTESVAVMLREVFQAMKDQNQNSVGDGLNAIFLQLRAAEEAIKESIATPFLPVIVLDATPEEVKGSLGQTLFFGRNVFFEATKPEVDTNDITNLFKELKKLRRGSRQTQNG